MALRKSAAGPILSASVAFVALSGGVEYAYAWPPASTVTLGFVRLKAAVSTVNRKGGLGDQYGSGARQTEYDGKSNCFIVETYKDSAGVADDIGRNRLFLRAHAF
jgi:hypothetical protein